MNNFLDFINSDIEVKKTLLSSLPTNTKTNIKKLNETIDEFTSKYEKYRNSVYKYIKAKAKSIKIKSKILLYLLIKSKSSCGNLPVSRQ